MAGDWIPYCKDLPRKPEVVAIAAASGKDRREVVAILLEFWAWVDEQSDDGLVMRTKVRDLSALCPHTDSQFWEALIKVGWLHETDQGICIPNFTYWMGASAKRRLREARRKSLNRQDQNLKVDAGGKPDLVSCGHAADNCPQRVRSHADTLRPTEQNRTVIEKKTTSSSLCGGRNSPTPPSCPEAEAASTQQAGGFAAPQEAVLLEFPTVGPSGRWALGEQQLARWQEAYPDLDCLAEAKKALAWLLANPARRKTSRGMPRFLVNWLSRAQDAGRSCGRAQPPAGASSASSASERLRRKFAEEEP